MLMGCEMIDFEKIPDWWPLCSNGACEQRESCLRWKAWQEVPAKTEKWLCLTPSAWQDASCRHYAKAEKVRMARGFHKLMDRLKNREHRYQIRIKLTDYLGSKGTYYRYKDGERPISPEQQQWIADLFAKYGYDSNIGFDAYEDEFRFETT